MVIIEYIERYYEENLKRTQGKEDVFDRVGARNFKSKMLKNMMQNN